MKFAEKWQRLKTRWHNSSAGQRLKNFWHNVVLNVRDIASQSPENPPIRNATLFGLTILIVFIGGFALWSILAPLESAAVAKGKVIIATNRKTIQHLEGGIIKEIFVREGTEVKKGAPLIKLEDTQAGAAFNLVHNQTNELYATQARLKAEINQSNTIQYPDILLNQKHKPEIKKLFDEQEQIFQNDKKTLEGQLLILRQRIEQLNQQIESLKAEIAANEKQTKFIQEELKAIQYLAERKLVDKPRLWSLQREAARLEGTRGEKMGKIAELEEKIGETEQQIITLKDQTQKDLLKTLNETNSKLTDALEKETAAADVLKRTLIVAPQDGVVLGLQEHTIGGVITAGKSIMDIVPKQDELLIEARLNPNDIDVVHVGLKAKVQLVAYVGRSTPWLTGEVVYVSADTFEDQQTQLHFYNARINIPAAELKKLKNVSLYPGMPVSVMIITERRTPFDYFITPIKDSFNKAFREQ